MLNAEELQAKLEAAQTRKEIDEIIVSHSRSIHEALEKTSKILADYKFTTAVLCSILDLEFGGAWSDNWERIQEYIKDEEGITIEINTTENVVIVKRRYSELENPNQKG